MWKTHQSSAMVYTKERQKDIDTREHSNVQWQFSMVSNLRPGTVHQQQDNQSAIVWKAKEANPTSAPSDSYREKEEALKGRLS